MNIGVMAAVCALGGLAAVNDAGAQCTALSGGVIEYCVSATRTVTASRSFSTSVMDSFSATGLWNRGVVAYDSLFDPPPNTSGAGSVYAGAGYAEQNTTLAANVISGVLRSVAWDGNQGYGGAGSSTLTTPFTLSAPVTGVITGSWSCSPFPGFGGDGSVPNVGFSLSGPAGGSYSAGYVNGPSPLLSGTLSFRAALPAGAYTLSARADQSFMNTSANLGSRTATVSFTFTLCPADFDLSGAVGVQDLFDFLGAYFANDPRADFNRSGAISVQDIFDFLAAYFAGCP